MQLLAVLVPHLGGVLLGSRVSISLQAWPIVCDFFELQWPFVAVMNGRNQSIEEFMIELGMVLPPFLDEQGARHRGNQGVRGHYHQCEQQRDVILHGPQSFDEG